MGEVQMKLVFEGESLILKVKYFIEISNLVIFSISYREQV